MAKSFRIHGPAARTIREGRGLSQTVTAERAEIPRSHLANVEAGRRNLSPAAALRLASTLKCDLEAILLDPNDSTEAAS